MFSYDSTHAAGVAPRFWMNAAAVWDAVDAVIFTREDADFDATLLHIIASLDDDEPS